MFLKKNVLMYAILLCIPYICSAVYLKDHKGNPVYPGGVGGKSPWAKLNNPRPPFVSCGSELCITLVCLAAQDIRDYPKERSGITSARKGRTLDSAKGPNSARPPIISCSNGFFYAVGNTFKPHRTAKTQRYN